MPLLARPLEDTRSMIGSMIHIDHAVQCNATSDTQAGGIIRGSSIREEQGTIEGVTVA
jgi:hypothetical protein